MKRGSAALLVGATALLWVQASPASAAVNYVVAAPGSRTTNSYATPFVVAAKGAPFTFRNQDVQTHSAVSDATGPDSQPWCKFFTGGCPLLWSAVTDAGGRESPILGLDNATSGEVYTLRCFVHPAVTGQVLVL